VAELPELLYELRNCKFVMIDTAGASPRDPELARRLRLLNQMQASIETSLVLPASTQAGAIDEVCSASRSRSLVLRHHQGRRGGEPRRRVVGADRHKLPRAYISDGSAFPRICSRRVRTRW
jgi:hypothetical protein